MQVLFLLPMVVSSLTDILMSFVQAGVNRIRAKKRQRDISRFKNATDEDLEPEDDRDLDVYLSFDQNDLGVAVFTNRIVGNELCPTLLRTFRAVDTVVGFDADREASFDKYTAKLEIAELILRLWRHPNGHCRNSVVSLPPDEIRSFVSSLSTAASVDFDFGTGALEKLYLTTKGCALRNFQGRDRAYLDSATKQASGMLALTRRYLTLLCALSQDETVAAAIGGYSTDDNDDSIRLDDNLPNMFFHFLEKLTSQDGGTNPNLEEGRCERTADILPRLGSLSPTQKQKTAEDVIGRRVRAKL